MCILIFDLLTSKRNYFCTAEFSLDKTLRCWQLEGNAGNLIREQIWPFRGKLQMSRINLFQDNDEHFVARSNYT